MMSSHKKRDSGFDLEYREQCQIDVEWYREHGRYPEDRIARAGGWQSVLYVIGDWAWNRKHPNRQELVDHLTPGFRYGSN